MENMKLAFGQRASAHRSWGVAQRNLYTSRRSIFGRRPSITVAWGKRSAEQMKMIPLRSSGEFPRRDHNPNLWLPSPPALEVVQFLSR